MTRVQIPPYTDRWMMGDQYGEIVKVSVAKGVHARLISKGRENSIKVAHVKLDKSGKTVRVIFDDCTPTDDRDYDWTNG